jgi:hypothetical protein
MELGARAGAAELEAAPGQEEREATLVGAENSFESHQNNDTPGLMTLSNCI